MRPDIKIYGQVIFAGKLSQASILGPALAQQVANQAFIEIMKVKDRYAKK